ncbi:MAG: polysaccharide deacetylase family protein [Pseudoxanthomonas sp.]|nr:polysaccharide deacetylase family protein [Pseudoxanthomonas sp.]
MSVATPPAAPPPGRRQRLARRVAAVGAMPLLQTARRLLRRDLRVYAWHRVRPLEDGFTFDPSLVSASPEGFREQVRHLRDRYRPLRCADLAEALAGGRPLPRDAVLLTFDDGYDDNFRFAFPILRELGVPALFFVATGHIDSGEPFAYDWLVHLLLTATPSAARLPAPLDDLQVPPGRQARLELAWQALDRIKALAATDQEAWIDAVAGIGGATPARMHPDCRPMDWHMLRSMRAGGMEIGSHGVSHRMLAKLDDAALLGEIRGSRARLDEELGQDTLAISYPVGGDDSFDARVLAAVEDAGYGFAFTYNNGSNRWPPARRHALLRQSVEADMDAAWFAGIAALPELFAHPSVQRTYPA